MTKVIPLANHIVVRRKAEAEVMPGKIIIPDVAKQKPQEGVVIAVGPGVWRNGKLVPLDFKVGESVVFSIHGGGVEITVDEEQLLIMKPDEVLAKVPHVTHA